VTTRRTRRSRRRRRRTTTTTRRTRRRTTTTRRRTRTRRRRSQARITTRSNGMAKKNDTQVQLATCKSVEQVSAWRGVVARRRAVARGGTQRSGGCEALQYSRRETSRYVGHVPHSLS
jgi:hypothetical protein